MERAGIRLDPFKRKNTFYYNGKKITRKTDFKDYETQPLLDWADEIYERIGREIYDDYHLSVCGDAFEKCFLEGLRSSYMSSDAQYGCLGYEKETYDVDTDISVRMKTLAGLAQKYGVKTGEMGRMPVFCRDEIFQAVPGFHEYAECVPMEEAQFVVEGATPLSGSAYNAFPARIVIRAGDTEAVFYNGKNAEGKKQYIWTAREGKRAEILGSIADHFFRTEKINYIAENLRAVFPSLSTHDQRRFRACITIENLCYVEDIPVLNIKGRYSPDVVSFPDGSVKAEFRMETENPAVVKVKGGLLVACAEGETVVNFYTPSEKGEVLFDSKPVRVTGIYIENITVDPQEIELSVDSSSNIRISIFPQDASDTQIECSCSDPSVAVISAADDGSFEIRGKRAGNCSFEFRAAKGGAAACCNVEVASTFSKKVSDSADNYYKGIVAFAAVLITGVLGMIFEIFETPFLIAAVICAYFMLKALALRHLDEKQRNNSIIALAGVVILLFLLFK